MTTTETNKLIAEFMGGTWEEKPHHPLIGIKSYNEKDLPKTTYRKVFTIPLETLPSEYAFGVFSIGKLRYHESWDWLMPVVEKIENCDGLSNEEVITIEYKDCIIPHHQGEVRIEGANSKLEAVYNAVVEFINQQNK